jgi:signal transduction histidine kinase
MRSDYELVPAFEDYCYTFGQRAGLEVEYQVNGVIPRLSAKLQLAAFRVLQEALTNVQKHARASNVRVGLVHMDGDLLLTVEDDGRGFNYQGDLKGHYGLANMRERAKQYSGELQIVSAEGRGCRISFKIPTAERE